MAPYWKTMILMISCYVKSYSIWDLNYKLNKKTNIQCYNELLIVLIVSSITNRAKKNRQMSRYREFTLESSSFLNSLALFLFLSLFYIISIDLYVLIYPRNFPWKTYYNFSFHFPVPTDYVLFYRKMGFSSLFVLTVEKL